MGLDVGDTRLPLVMSEISDAQVQSLLTVVDDLADLALTLPVPASTTA